MEAARPDNFLGSSTGHELLCGQPQTWVTTTSIDEDREVRCMRAGFGQSSAHPGPAAAKSREIKYSHESGGHLLP